MESRTPARACACCGVCARRCMQAICHAHACCSLLRSECRLRTHVTMRAHAHAGARVRARPALESAMQDRACCSLPRPSGGTSEHVQIRTYVLRTYVRAHRGPRSRCLCPFFLSALQSLIPKNSGMFMVHLLRIKNLRSTGITYADLSL